MRKLKLKWLLPLMVILTAVFLSGCKTPEPPPAPPKKVESNLSYAWLGFPQPCPTPDAAKVLIEKWTPKVVKPGQTFNIKIKVQNKANYEIAHTDLIEELPDQFSVIRVSPAPSKQSRNSVEWSLDNVKSGKAGEYIITGKISSVGSVRYSGKSVLNFETDALKGGESVVNVIAPDLNIEAYSPSTSIINKRIPIEITFKNSGTASVNDAKLFYTLPRGLLTYQGKSTIEMDIGTIAPMQTLKKSIDLKGTEVGDYKLKFNAVAENNIEASSTLGISITKPALTVQLIAPNKRYVGNVIPYNITVRNTGNAVAENTVIELTLPDGTTLASIDNNGKKNGNSITWDIGTLHVNETKKVNAKVVANRIMTARASATTEADEADKLEVAKTTDVAGISALLCTLNDVHDPVPVGEQEEYTLIATNQGSLPTTKIIAKCYLEDSMEYVKSSGATKGRLEGNVLVFESLPELAPQAEAKWSIFVKAVKPGDVRFKAEVISEQLTKPVTLVEPTNFYE